MSSINLTGYQLTFDDEFNTRSISQTGANTTYADIRPESRFDANSDIGFGKSSFVDAGSGYDPFSVKNGALSITAAPPGTTSSGYPGSWQSGLISTQNSFSQTYGYFEIRADFSNNPNAWDAFWLLPNQQSSSSNTDASHQELDVVENYGNNATGVYSTIHTTDPQPAGVSWQDDRQVYSTTSNASGYHTYGMNWQANTITFYVDGQAVGSQATPSDMHSPMYMLADLAVQGTAGSTGSPMTSSIDYIRAYSNAANAVAVTQGTVSSPDGSDPGLYGATAAGTTKPDASTTATGTKGNSNSNSDNSGHSTTAPVTETVGTGSDKLVLNISQDAYQGDAQYVVYVDGKQIGGTLTAHAAHMTGSSAQDDQLTVLGNFGSGQHSVGVNFLNDAYGGSAALDRNLYVDSASFNGTAVANSSLTLLNNGGQYFTVPSTATTVSTPASTTTGSTVTAGTPTSTGSTGTSTTAPVAETVGTGSDKLVLNISQDAYQGDAQYVVYVDGHQIGGTLTAHAAHTAGSSAQDDQLTVLGNFGSGAHSVGVNFLNDAYGGSAALDRNLYVDSASFNGTAVANSSLALLNSGGQYFNVPSTATTVSSPAVGTTTGTTTTGSSSTGGTTAVSTPAGSSVTASNPTSTGSTSTSTTAPVTETVGSGPDKLVLGISQDAYQGDAQYVVYVDGHQIGGTLTAHAAHTAGSSAQDDQLTVLGNFGSGAHSVGVNFLNDAYGGSAALDRNLYVDSASFNGTAVANSSLALLNSGGQYFNVPSTATTVSSPAVGATTGTTTTGSSSTGTTVTTSTPTSTSSTSISATAVATTLGTGPDKLVLSISQDAYQGDAQYTVFVDGKQIGGTLTAHAAHMAGSSAQDDQLTLMGNFGSGQHTVDVNFLNDAYGGSAALDRNLYVDSASYNGTAVANGSLELMNTGYQHFGFTSH